MSTLCMSLTFSSQVFRKSSPYLALLTEPDAASCKRRRLETLDMLESACCCAYDNDYDDDEVVEAEDGVDLLSIRVDRECFDEEELKELLKCATQICGDRSIVVLNISCEKGIPGNELYWVVEYGADGVHVKESSWDRISRIKSDMKALFAQSGKTKEPIIGSSCHSVSSALRAARVGVDYLFVGTCFPTLTHPEKSEKDLEGPQLVREVRSSLNNEGYSHIPILAVGGINEKNCHIPVSSDFNADGVAVIRSITGATKSRQAVSSIKRALRRSR